MAGREIRSKTVQAIDFSGLHLVDDGTKLRIKGLQDLISHLDINMLTQLKKLLDEEITATINNLKSFVGYESGSNNKLTLKEEVDELKDDLINITGYDEENKKGTLQEQIDVINNTIGAIKSCDCDENLLLDLGTNIQTLDDALKETNENVSNLVSRIETIENDLYRLNNDYIDKSKYVSLNQWLAILDYAVHETRNNIGYDTLLQDLDTYGTVALRLNQIQNNYVNLGTYSDKITELENRIAALEEK